MNIFKKIGSFASTSWKDFSELYGDQQMLEVSLKKEEGGDENDQTVITSSSESGGDGSSFELRKRPEMEIAAKKNGQGFFRRHFSKRKLKQQIQLVDDPRSPTTAFARTPIQAFEVAERADILSPFNVQDMLSTVKSAVDGTPTKTSSLALDNGSRDVLVDVHNSEEQQLLEDDDFTNNVGNWNDFQFERKDNVMTESLIVELSTLDINKEDNANCSTSSNALTTTITPSFDSDSDSVESCDEATEYLLQVDEVQEVIEKVAEAEGDEDDQTSQKCKIVGCIVKSDDSSVPVSTNENVVTPTASTPKKKKQHQKQSATSKLATEEPLTKLPRTPLQAISHNSPMVSAKSKAGKGSVAEQNLGQKKKKLNSGVRRKLPKAPATPLTPLFKQGNPPPANVVSHFDKENF